MPDKQNYSLKVYSLTDFCFFLHNITANIPPIPIRTKDDGSGVGAVAGSPALICTALITAS